MFRQRSHVPSPGTFRGFHTEDAALDMKPGMDRTIYLRLSIGRHVKFDTLRGDRG